MKRQSVLFVILMALALSACEVIGSSQTSQQDSPIVETSSDSVSSDDPVTSEVDSSDIEISVTPELVVEHATVNGLEDSYKVGETAVFTVLVNDGYKIVSVSVNDKVVNAVEGVYSVVVDETLNIKVDARLAVFSLSGTVKLEENDLTEEQAGDFVVTLANEGDYYESTLTNDAGVYTYSFANVAEGEDFILTVLATAEDTENKYTVYTAGPLAILGDEEHDVVIPKEKYGENRVFDLVESYAKVGVMGQPFNYGVYGNPGNHLTASMLFECDQILLNEDGSFITDPTYGEDANNFMSLTVSTWLITDGEFSAINVQILHWNTTWYAKISGEDDSFVDYRLSTDQIGKLANGGLELRLSRSGNLYHLFVDDLNSDFTLIGTVKSGTKNSVFAYMDNKVEGGFSADYTFKVTGTIKKDVMGPKFETAVVNIGNNSININGEWGTQNAHSNSNGYKNRYLLQTKFQFNDVLDEDGNIQYTEGLIFGYRLNIYNAEDQWGRFDLFILCYDNKYYLKAEQGSTPFDIVLTDDQVKLIGTTGLETVMIRNTSDTRVYADDGNGDLVEAIIAINGNYNFKYLDLIKNGGTTGSFNMLNTIVYHEYDAELTNLELLELIK